VVELRPLSDALGVEVLGLDVSRPFAIDDIDALHDAFDEHHLLLFRDQSLSGEQQMGFVARFGPLLVERTQPWGYVSNVHPDGIVREGGLLFHSDFAFAREPVLALSLFALEVPADGAPTLFANAARAARTLPDDLRVHTEGRLVHNIFDFHWPGDQRVRAHQMAPGSPGTDHPVRGRHPRSGVEVLFTNEMHSDSIVGLPEAESEALLAAIHTHCYAPANCYEHAWRVGDLLLWDNIALHHGRPTIPTNAARTLQRVSLGRYTPAELVPNLAALLAG
jgi:taurine dioxygenase